MPFPLSIAITAFNEEANIMRCLKSAADLAEEIVVVDSGSTDRTKDLAGEFKAAIVHQAWLGHSRQKQVAIEHCTKDWVLVLDCDEELSPELRESIAAFFKTDACHRHHGAWFSRKVWFLGRWITHGDWYPDRKLRLVRRKNARMSGNDAHDAVEVNGSTIVLAGDLHHYSFPSMNRYVEKINVFADLFLEQQKAKGKTWSLFANVTRPLWRFFRAYVLRLGFLDGFPGLWIAISTAYFTFVRYSRKFEDEVNPRSSP